MRSQKYVLPAIMIVLGLYALPALAEQRTRGMQIESIDDKRTEIVAGDIAYSLAPSLVVRDADGKTVSRSALRKGVRFSATKQREPGKQFVITEIQLLDADRNR